MAQSSHVDILLFILGIRENVYLGWCSNSPIHHGYPAGVFYEATCIVIFNLLYGMHHVGRDVNTVSFYGLVCYLVYLPFYFLGIDVSAYHNYAAKGLNALIVLRLFYFGNRDLLANISIIDHSKKWLLDGRLFLNTYINGLTIAVFFLCAIPLCTLIYLVNTDTMRVTGIAVILFSFFIAFDSSRKNTGARTQAQAIDIPLFDERKDALDKANHTIWEMKNLLKIISIAAIICAICLPQTVDFYQRSFFDLGYASGYNDAKSGTAAKRETGFKKALWCIEVSQQKIPMPPGYSCLSGN